MKINDILTESQQQDLAEGPMLNKIGSGIGKVAGTVAKGLGAVAGGVAGAGQALKKGYQAGKGVVGAAGDNTAAPQATTAPTAQQVNKQGPAGTAPAKQQTGVAAQAMQKTAKAMSGQNAVKAGETLYAQVKAQVGQLDKKGKQRILQLLQKSLQQTPAAAPAAAPQVARKGGPVKVAGGAAKPAPTQQTAGKIDNRPALSESFSLYRKK